MHFDGLATRFRLFHRIGIPFLIVFALIILAQPHLAASQVDDSVLPPSSALTTSDKEDFETKDNDEAIASEATLANSERTRHRLVLVGLVGATLLGWMAVLFAYLRLEHATRGFYSGKLQSASVVCAVAIIGLCYFVYISLFP